MTELTPQEHARAILEARIRILVDEALATSAIEGIALDAKEVRKSVLRHLAHEMGLIPSNPREYVPYVIAEDDLELTILAIERYRKVTTVSEFEKARLFATGVNVRLLRVRPDLDKELTQVYLDAKLRLGLGPEDADPN